MALDDRDYMRERLREHTRQPPRPPQPPPRIALMRIILIAAAVLVLGPAAI